MAVVTISSEMGSGGPEIGAALAQRLGYRYVDREVISQAARQYGLVEARLADLDERKPTLFQRFDAETRRYTLGTQAALCELAQQDDVVLMGRGGQWLLRGIPHVLRVRVTAPFEDRVHRLAAKRVPQAASATPPRALVEMVRQDDAGRAGRTRYLYDIDINDPTLYDVLINTTILTVEAAVDLLETLLRHSDLATTEASRRLVADRALGARVEMTLATHQKTRKARITVEAEDGVVTLEAATDLTDASAVARDVPGVRDVRARPREIPPVPPFVA
jgi:cytidylate kinase